MGDNNLNVFDVQDVLKYHASHGFDLTHPHGAVIHGKLYPTLNKEIVHMKTPEGSGVIASAEIPLESGNIIHLENIKHVPKYKDDAERKIVYANLLHPVTTPATEKSSAHHHYNLVRGNGEDGVFQVGKTVVKLTEKDVHEKIKKLMDMPSSGQIWPADQDSDILTMSGPDYITHARVFNAAEQAHNHYTPRMHKSVGINSNGDLEYQDNAYGRTRIVIPKGHIHIENFGRGRSGEMMKETEYYAYDPANETLKRAEVEQ